MSNLTVLRPRAFRPAILFNCSETCLTVFDAFPKAIFHFLVLPRVRPPLRVSDLTDLRSLLKCERKNARAILQDLSDEADSVKKLVQEEMLNRYGFQWQVWAGFHPAPSMEHLHLHVISSDLCSPKLKNKKHYNSFHPKLGFFLHLSDVLSWFDADPSYFEKMSQLRKKDYEPLLKEDLTCWKCEGAVRNMPTLKEHLQEEWDDERRREKARIAKKNASLKSREVSQPGSSPSQG
ncbi:HIT-like protein [Pisolithus croceorrhizus]|nr:HIT-like protein [Pisolithus croceorrhizus]